MIASGTRIISGEYLCVLRMKTPVWQIIPGRPLRIWAGHLYIRIGAWR